MEENEKNITCLQKQEKLQIIFKGKKNNIKLEIKIYAHLLVSWLTPLGKTFLRLIFN